MPLRPRTHPEEPAYPRRRPRRLGLGLCGVIIAGALGCTTTAQPPPAAPTPEVLVASPRPPAAAEAAPEPGPPPEPDWVFDGSLLAREARVPLDDDAEVALVGRSAAAAVTPAHGARVMGSISREIIREGVRAGLEDFRACWQGPSGRGLEDPLTVAARFIIAGDGRVREAEVRVEAPGGEALSECLVDVFEGLRFPPVPGGGVVTINYPLRFVTS